MILKSCEFEVLKVVGFYVEVQCRYLFLLIIVAGMSPHVRINLKNLFSRRSICVSNNDIIAHYNLIPA